MHQFIVLTFTSVFTVIMVNYTELNINTIYFYIRQRSVYHSYTVKRLEILDVVRFSDSRQ